MRVDREILDFCAFCRDLRPAVTVENVRAYVAGVERTVPVIGGGERTYVNLDNAATTPPFTPVLDCVTRFFDWYSSVHRGGGFKSVVSTRTYEHCRAVVAEFVGADPTYHTVIFTQNATQALNKLAATVAARDGRGVLTTLMEHHSNLLPWRRSAARVEHVAVRPDDGRLDLADLDRRLQGDRGPVGLVTVTGASNVTGVLPPIREIARRAHARGALVAVDGAQLIPHRPFRMGAFDDPERIDFLAFSAHKMYAPLGSGVLVGPTAAFEEGAPAMVGGGTVDLVTADEAIWTAPPEREEAGTPNVVGALALASAMRILSGIGMEDLAEHERALTRRLLARLGRVPGVHLAGPTDPGLTEDRVGVVSMTVDGFRHADLAAILGYEWGIGVRSGCFCAQPYVRRLMGIPDTDLSAMSARLAAVGRAGLPGLVRFSLGVYNTEDEIDYAVDALAEIIARGSSVKYVIDPEYGDAIPDPASSPMPAIS